MSIQTIINICESIEVNRRKVVGVQFTRNEIPKISSTPTRNPWKFNLVISALLPYDTNRGLLEEIDRLDRIYNETVNFSQFSWLFKYQGVMTNQQLSALRVVSFEGTTLTLGSLPSVNSSSYLFKAGDLIQIADLPHPFTITQNVQRGSGDTVQLITHRPNFLTDSMFNQSVTVGNNCEFKVFCPNMPTWKIVPSGRTPLIEWTSDFQLYEDTGAQ